MNRERYLPKRLFWGGIFLCSVLPVLCTCLRAGGSYDPARLRDEPAIRAVLDMIAYAEVGELGAGGYHRVFGWPPRFAMNLNGHPSTVVYSYLGGKRIGSTASGRYQFLKRTWDLEAAELSLNDFSPLSQDLAAINQLVKAGAIEDARRHDLKSFFAKTCKIWASLPGSPYGQPTRQPEDLKRLFKNRYAFYRRRAMYA